MSYRIEIENPNLLNAISQLQNFDGVMNAEHKKAMRQIVNASKALIFPNIPTRTGKAKGAFRTMVGGSVGFGNSGDEAFGEENVSGYGQKFVVGRVGWFGSNQPWYINIVEYGAGPHDIVPKDKEELYFNGTFTKLVHHPGFPARHFMADGYEETAAIAEMYLGLADEQIANQIAEAVSAGTVVGGESGA